MAQIEGDESGHMDECAIYDTNLADRAAASAAA